MLKNVKLLPNFCSDLCSDHGISVNQEMWNKINEIITSLHGESNKELSQNTTKLSEDCGKCESRRYSKERNEHFLNFVCSSWFINHIFSLIRVYYEIQILFLNQKTTSEMIRVGNPEEIKRYIEAVTYSHIEIEILNSMDIVIKINMDYSLLSESEYIRLKKEIQRHDFTEILKAVYNDIK